MNWSEVLEEKKDASKIEKYFKNCFSSELESKIYNYDYDALVLSDKAHKIIWVSDGFKDMTGYTKKFAVGKKPSFLQGEKDLYGCKNST